MLYIMSRYVHACSQSKHIFMRHMIRFLSRLVSNLCILSEQNSTLHFSQPMFWLSTTPPHHNRFTILFPGAPGWAGARRELLDFMVQGKINRGRHTDHPAGCHSIRTNQCPPPPSPHILLRAGCPSCRPTNDIKALKATSTFGLERRC